MKTLVASLSVLMTICQFAIAQDMQSSQNDVALQAVVEQIKEALADVQTELAQKSLPPLQSVKLTLQTTASAKGGAKIKLWVISFGHTWERDKAQQVDIELTPPNAGNERNVSTKSLTEELEDLILNAAQGVKDAGVGKIPLKWTGLTVELGFTVKGDTSGGANVQIVPITAEFSGDLSKTAVQKLVITFKSPTPKKG